MDVHIVADDPVSEAVAAALGDLDVGVVDATPDQLSEARFGLVADVAGAGSIDRAASAAREGGTPWIAVEVGGVGGVAIDALDAAVSGFAPGTACFDCLRTRVHSALDEPGGEPTAERSAVRLAGAIAGRECARVLSGAEETILGGVREVPYARRRLLPVPGCSCETGPRDRTLDREDDESLSLEAAIDRADRAIDDRLGPVASIGEVESFPAPYYLATLTDTTAFSDAKASTQAAGVADDWNAALMKAVGEGLERYCAGVYRDAAFVHASASELENPVTPGQFVRPADSATVDDETELRWVAGMDLETGESVHLPADAVQFPQPGEGSVASITTGLGLGSSTVDALLAGLTEVIERDAAMLAWYSSYEPLGLSIDDDAFETLRRRARSEDLVVTPLLVTQDVDVPVVSVAVHRSLDAPTPEASWPHFAMGSAASLDATAAARSALEEALQNWMELRGMGAEEASTKARIADYAAFPEAARALVDVDQHISADSVGPSPVPTGRDALDELVAHLTAASLQPYAASITTRDVDALGFDAVRVVVPGTQPLFTGEAYFGDRATTVPRELGFEPRLDGPYHPYP